MIGGSSSDADNIRGPKGRSYKFAEKLTGRFFVSGVSGSFQKYNKFLNRIEEKEAKEKYTYAPVMEKHRKEELKMEAQRLMEIEEKLNEVSSISTLWNLKCKHMLYLSYFYFYEPCLH